MRIAQFAAGPGSQDVEETASPAPHFACHGVGDPARPRVVSASSRRCW